MTGQAHYAKAEEHLAQAAAIETDGHDDSSSAWHQRQAQAHATLARHADMREAVRTLSNDLAAAWARIGMLEQRLHDHEQAVPHAESMA